MLNNKEENSFPEFNFDSIALDLEQYHAIFSKFWRIGKPIFSKEIKTAAISFDEKGNILEFLFNPDFWNKISNYERQFVICHEMLHIILEHGSRLLTLNKDIGNIAADVVINELIINGFGMNRDRIPFLSKNGCWLNTTFKNNSNVEKDKSMEYYYNLLLKNLSMDLSKLIIVDDHDGLMNIPSDKINKIVEDILDDLNEYEKTQLKEIFESIDGEIEELEQISQQAGTFAGNLIRIMNIGNVKKKKKWETVIKKWATIKIITKDRDYEQWARMNRRFATLNTDFFLPSEMEIEDREEEKKKIKVIFFQDTSGSCRRLAERFFKAAKSLPSNRFDVELYCFDRKVHKTSLESGKLYGFGGTSFNILENYVYDTISKGNLNQYPKAIFVITDGYGNKINPRIPKRWYWFLSTACKRYIPSECNIFDLSKFE